MRGRHLVIGMLALATGLGARAASADSPADDPDRALKSFVGAMSALRDFNTRVCEAEPPAMFDVTEIGRRALGRHAQDRSKAEVTELGELVTRRLLRWYSGLINRERPAPPAAPSTTDPIFGAGTAIGSWATISAITPGRRRTFVYHLRWTGDGSWRVYDLEINGRSRVRTYYTEFDRIILNEGYRVLVRRIRAEVEREAPRVATAATPDRCR